MSKRRAGVTDCQPCGLPQPVRWDLLGWSEPGAAPEPALLLLENGSNLLLEDGEPIKLEVQP